MKATSGRESTESLRLNPDDEFPLLMTAGETAVLLRTSRAAIYVMAERRQLPGITRIGRRILFRTRDLLDWLDQKRAPSPEE
jgi:excisionase family DNA binding protein